MTIKNTKKKTKIKTKSARKRRQKVKRRMSRKSLIRKADAIFSKYIRARDSLLYDGKCVFCGKREINQVFHIITRSKYSVRWDEDNAFGSCGRCNLVNEFNPHPFIAKYIKMKGLEQYKKLVELSNVTTVFDDYTLGEIIVAYTRKLQNLRQRNIMGEI